ncbi:unnamed protein product [Dovyalis caffra]|uniref:Uncharacterized protein n=1 Tax=Dovyalis caffra TaxID=77055 RepID=A0AAV1SL57_9ROSI|nr:unnamed protein product [Dovyalis caffra]
MSRSSGSKKTLFGKLPAKSQYDKLRDTKSEEFTRKLGEMKDSGFPSRIGLSSLSSCVPEKGLKSSSVTRPSPLHATPCQEQQSLGYSSATAQSLRRIMNDFQLSALDVARDGVVTYYEFPRRS